MKTVTARPASTVAAVRSGQAAVLALLAAIVGGALVLVVAKAGGWLHRGTTQTVVIHQAGPGPSSSHATRSIPYTPIFSITPDISAEA